MDTKVSDLVWEKVKLGKYKHAKKGMMVEVVGCAKHSETLEDLVVYKHDGNFWVRPLAMFFDEVEIGGKMVQRFQFSEK